MFAITIALLVLASTAGVLGLICSAYVWLVPARNTEYRKEEAVFLRKAVPATCISFAIVVLCSVILSFAFSGGDDEHKGKGPRCAKNERCRCVMVVKKTKSAQQQSEF